MAKLTLKIDSVISGVSESYYIGSQGTFDSSIAIDPDFPIIGYKASGMLVPVGYVKVSAANLTSTPLWLITTPKNTYIYVYCSDGRFLRYDPDMTNETLIGTVPSSSGNGATYYNNYIYLSGNTDISRYGPLSGTPALTNNVWTGATLGTQTALSNYVYPSLRGVPMPNHYLYAHSNNSLYVADSLNGQGVIHKISTSKTTSEGDTNDNSAYNVLDLNYGYYPTCITPVGTDIAISAIQTSSTSTIIQGKAGMFFWDTINPNTFYKQLPWDDSMITAMINSRGTLFVFSGNTVTGVRMSAYLGGDQFKELAYLDDSFPPLPGAVDTIGGRVIFGGFSTNPTAGGAVYAYGSKNRNLPLGLHNVAKATASGTFPLVTMLKVFQQDSAIKPKYAIGWKDSSSVGIDNYSVSGNLSSVFRRRFQLGKPFKVLKVYIPTGIPISGAMNIVAKIYVDDDTKSVTLNTINNANYSGKKLIRATPTIAGEFNLMFELTWSGSTVIPVTLPIQIIIEETD